MGRPSPWAGRLLDSVAGRKLAPTSLRQGDRANICIVDYNDGTTGAVISGRDVGWTFAGDVDGQPEPTIISMLGWPGPCAQYHAANGQPHWITEMMVTKREPFNAERLLLSTGITNHHGIELGERPLLGDWATHKDAGHEHEIPHDTRADVREG